MFRLLLVIIVLCSGCASSKQKTYSATNLNKRQGGDFLDQVQEGLNSVMSGATKQQAMLLVDLSAQFHQKYGKWPSKADDLVFDDGSKENQKITAKDVRFLPKNNNDLIIKYTNYRGYTDGVVLSHRKDGDAYVFCFMMSPDKECTNFIAVSVK